MEKCVSLKNLVPSQKTLRPTWCPKLVTGLLCPDGPRVHLSDPVYTPSCMRPEVRRPLDQRILCTGKKITSYWSQDGNLFYMSGSHVKQMIKSYTDFKGI